MFNCSSPFGNHAAPISVKTPANRGWSLRYISRKKTRSKYCPKIPFLNSLKKLSNSSLQFHIKTSLKIPHLHSPFSGYAHMHCIYCSVWDRSQGLAICHQGAHKGAPPLTAFSLSGCGEGTTPPLDDSEWDEVSPGESGCFSAPDDQQLTASYGGGVVHFDCRCVKLVCVFFHSGWSLGLCCLVGSGHALVATGCVLRCRKCAWLWLRSFRALYNDCLRRCLTVNCSTAWKKRY